MVKFFTSKGVDPTYKDTLKQTAIYYAAREDQSEMIRYLVE
jgi:ankyrin repeat protein